MSVIQAIDDYMVGVPYVPRTEHLILTLSPAAWTEVEGMFQHLDGPPLTPGVLLTTDSGTYRLALDDSQFEPFTVTTRGFRS